MKRLQNKFFLIIFLGISVAFHQPLFAGPQPETLSISILNWDGTPAAGGIQFPVEEATFENPWIISPQYIRVVYSSDEIQWGIRIITDNEVNIGQVYPKPLNEGPDNQWEWKRLGLPGYQYVGGQWQTGDDSASFGGLINSSTKNNQENRADLAWQVFKDPVPEPDPIYYHPWGSWFDYWNVGSNPVLRNGTWRYPYEWARVIDKSDKWNGIPSVGGISYDPQQPPTPLIYYDPQPPEEWNARYEIIITGDPFSSYLTQYPPMQQTNPDIRPGDCDIAVYIAACFGVMKNGTCERILPKGNYSTRIYIELMHDL